MDEIKLPNNVFEIGLIKLSIENIQGSEILIPLKLIPLLILLTRPIDEISVTDSKLTGMNQSIYPCENRKNWVKTLNNMFDY